MPPEWLAQLTRSIEEGERVGFGLSTVHERLQLFFGPPYGLSISSQPGVGTRVEVCIPKEWKRGRRNDHARFGGR